MPHTPHTPGPWEIVEGGNFVKVGAKGFQHWIEKHHYLGGPLSVADVQRNATDDYKENHALAMANAKLIAAAPDLADALEKIANLEIYKNGSAADYAYKIDAIARAALKKAGR